jgi:hypothetical protein
LKNENIKLGFRVSRIWLLNLIAMVGKIGPSDVFTATNKEEHELSYHSNATYEPSNSEAEVAIMC